jgi:hypothetical protein
MKKVFKCSCHTHLLKIEFKVEKTLDLNIGIYNIYNPDTGKKYKKPKLINDVQFLGCEPYAKEMDFLMKFLEEIVMQYIMRKK